METFIRDGMAGKERVRYTGVIQPGISYRTWYEVEVIESTDKTRIGKLLSTLREPKRDVTVGSDV